MPRPSTFRQIENVTNADSIKPISCSDALRDTGRDLLLFTPALILTHGRFDRDPVMEFDARYDLPSADYRPFIVDLKPDAAPFFEGLGRHTLPGRQKAVDWDRRLYAMDKEYAYDCFEFLGGMCWSDKASNMFASVMSYDLRVPDPTACLGEYLQVKIFGVLANTFAAYLAQRVWQPPVATRVPIVNGTLPVDMPRTNFLGTIPQEDPLNMREEP